MVYYFLKPWGKCSVMFCVFGVSQIITPPKQMSPPAKQIIAPAKQIIAVAMQIIARAKQIAASALGIFNVNSSKS